MPLVPFLLSVTPTGYAAILGLLYCMWLTYRIVVRGNRKKVTAAQKVRIYGSVFLLVSIVTVLTLVSTVVFGQHIYNGGLQMNISSAISSFFGFVAVGLLLMLFVGTMLYAMNRDMQKYKKIAGMVMVGFVIPLIILSFDVALIYGLLKDDEPGNEKQLWTYLVLVLFIVALSLALFAYIKMLLAGTLIDAKKNNTVAKKKTKTKR